MKDRISWVDNAKALGIYLVVLGHLPLVVDAANFIYSFHIPLFFFLSGVNFRKNPGITLAEHVQKKSKSILVPYFFFSFLTYIFWLFIGRKFGNNPALAIDVYKPLAGIFYSNGIDNWMIHNGPMWFLTCLFIVDVWFFLLAKNFNDVGVSIALLISAAIGYALSLTDFVRLPWGINVALTGIFFYGAGYFFMKMKSFPLNKISTLAGIFFSIDLCGYFSILNGRIDMNGNSYGNVWYFYIAAGFGIVACVLASKVLPASGLLSYIGRNTIIILALHSVVGSIMKGVMVFFLKIPISFLDQAIACNIIFAIVSISILMPVAVFINRYLPKVLGKW